MDRDDADDVLVERVVDSILAGLVPGGGVQDLGGQVELLAELGRPLLSKGGRADHQQPAPALRPVLAQDQGRLDGLAQANFIGQQDTLG